MQKQLSVILLAVFLILSLLPIAKCQVFWLDGWSYRSKFSVTSNMNNFQGNITINLPATFLDSIRVTEDDGVTLIPIWNETNSIIWCRFPYANESYYLYWGNTNGSSVWNNIAVFNRVINSGIALSWPINEGSGTTVNDYSGNEYDGTIIGATWTSTGLYGNALIFDGAGDGITTTADLDFPANFTWIISFKSGDSATSRAFLSKRTTGNYYEARINIGGGIQLLLYDGTLYSKISGANYDDNVYRSLAIRREGSTVSFYNNGVWIENDTSNKDTSNANYFQGGSYGAYNDVFNGTLNHILLFNSVLSTAELLDLATYYPMASGSHLGSLYLRSWWIGSIGALGEQENMISEDDSMALGAIAFIFALAAIGFVMLKQKK